MGVCHDKMGVHRSSISTLYVTAYIRVLLHAYVHSCVEATRTGERGREKRRPSLPPINIVSHQETPDFSSDDDAPRRALHPRDRFLDVNIDEVDRGTDIFASVTYKSLPRRQYHILFLVQRSKK